MVQVVKYKCEVYLKEGKIVVGLICEKDDLHIAVCVRAACVFCLILAVCGVDVRGLRYAQRCSTTR